MDIWKIEKPFDYKIFFSNLTPHAILLPCDPPQWEILYYAGWPILSFQLEYASFISWIRKTHHDGSRKRTTEKSPPLDEQYADISPPFAH